MPAGRQCPGTHQHGGQVIYRLYTESSPEYDENTFRILDAYFGGYTWWHAEGRYKGHAEHSLIVEVVGDADLGRVIMAAAREIRAENRQDAVLVVSQLGACVYVKREN